MNYSWRPLFLDCLIVLKVPYHDPLGVTDKMLRIDAVGYMDTERVTKATPTVVLGVHPLNFTIIIGASLAAYI